jgi:fructose/tagatose bisphosphate aldolase
MSKQEIKELIDLIDNSIKFEDGKVLILSKDKLQANIDKLVDVSVFGKGTRQGLARYIIRLTSLAFGAIPASIHDLYIARGNEKFPHTFTVPAINLRMLSFDAARAVFRVANKLNAGAFIFEIARSEMGYTDQRPAEYVSNILAAAIKENYTGPVFIQGDHFQVSASRYASDPKAELQAVKDLTEEAIKAGYFNIDIDTSTLVDLNKTTVPEQQELNSTLSAMFTEFIRSMEPDGVTISIGGEIGEVGGHNSTEEELRAYMDGFNTILNEKLPDVIGLSKISIQTGTSHGGVVLSDGSIADVSVDFNTMLNLSQVARREFGMGGAVQHGASTLPEEAFGKFVEAEAIEVHLATNFQNMAFDRLSENLKMDIYTYLNEEYASNRKPDMTDDQFYYKNRKYAVGPFKEATWNMPGELRQEIFNAWEKQFETLFTLLGVKDTRNYVDQTVTPVIVNPKIGFYLGETKAEEDVSDLAD